MNKTQLRDVFLTIIVVLGVASYSHAGGDRFIMVMTEGRMNQENLVYARFIGPDGVALESDALGQMVIREQDCSSGPILKVIFDYKMGYAPKNLQVGIYLYPHVWNNKTLCFSVPNLGKVEQSLNPTANNGRSFQFRLVP